MQLLAEDDLEHQNADADCAKYEITTVPTR